MKSKRIFVYGSLRESFFNYEKYLKGKVLNRISESFISGKLFHLLEKGYPAVIPGEDIVFGEVFDVIDDGKVLEAVHDMEGFISPVNPDNLYKLEMMVVTFSDGSNEVLPVYVYNSTEDEIVHEDSGVYIPEGDWKSFMIRKG